MPEKPDIEERVSTLERWQAGTIGSNKTGYVFLVLMWAALGWYLADQIKNIDDSKIGLNALATSMSLLNATVTQDTLQIRDINGRLRDLELANQLLSAKLTNVQESRAQR